ncbi:MAG TPA: DUF2231 domain-containing protein, partial [Chitinophagaceae bacterium]|nr:DUF2231 domain-containing protein [Chitinophagaceae bacterium]
MRNEKNLFMRVAENALFGLNIFIIFLLVAGSLVVIPTWLQPVGRMHPMLLHFPIVILLLAMFLELFNFRNKYKDERFYHLFADGLLLIGALSSAVTATMGLLLSKEPGYEGSVLQWHKIWGVGLVFVASFIYWSRNKQWFSRIGGKITAAISLVTVVLAAHLGSVLTHGENFIMQPMNVSDQVVSVDQAMIFEHVVRPVFEQKCMNCHNEEKHKGNLILSDSAWIAKGGRTGKLFDTGDSSLSLLLKRIHLPMDHRKHMPPSGKPQLTQDEITLIEQWVKSGMPFAKKLIDLPAKDSLRIAATAKLYPGVDADELYDFAEADEETIRKLNNNYRVVAPLGKESPALAVTLYNRAVYKTELLNDLMPVKEQIVSLELNKLPVKDEDLKVVSNFKNLRRLNLNFTDVTAAGLSNLLHLQHLKALSLSGTKMTAAALSKIMRLEGLAKVVVWNTGIDSNGVAQLRKINPAVEIEQGYRDDTTRIQLNAPKFVNKADPGSFVVIGKSLDLQLSHPIRGVEIRYTTDGKKPDSVNSRLFVKDTIISENTIVEARAFKPGWLGSDSIKVQFYKSTFKPDTVYLLTEANEKYRGVGGATFTNLLTGNFDLNTDKWIAYREKEMDVIFEFKNPVTISSVGLHYLLNTGPWLFPAERIELWAGNSKEGLQLISAVKPL